jgi:uncharacterized protein (DUF1499 family)
MSRRKVITVILLSIPVLLFILVVGGLASLSIFSPGPKSLGVTNGKLSPCPSSPNCVCSESDDGEHHIQPFAYTGDGKEALVRVKRIIENEPRTRIVTSRDNYLHAEFTSLIFRYVDDVEFLIDEKTHVLEVRSASRAGHSDLGANRRRVENLRTAFSKQ